MSGEPETAAYPDGAYVCRLLRLDKCLFKNLTYETRKTSKLFQGS
ncbi:MAG: hypothetical protein QW036_04960 [Zestosphaera sp.]